ncbi:MAG: rubrerythrin family protein [Lewinella sp.]
MKNSILILALGVTSLWMLLPSCTDKAAEQTELTATSEVKPQASRATNVGEQDAQKMTIQNMHDAYKGETTAHAKYAAYSKKAEEEGHPEIALLFTAASGAELIHANNHKVVLVRMGEIIPEITPEFTVNSTAENLKEAIEGESYEFNTMYPEFIKNANAAGNYMAQISLTYAYKVEQKHRDFYIAALAALDAGTDHTLAKLYFLCPTCGNTYATTAPSRCEISMTDSKLFIRVTSADVT